MGSATHVSKTENIAPQETLPAEITSPPTITEEEKEGKEAYEEITTPSCPHEDTSKPEQEPNEAHVTTGGKSQNFCLMFLKINSLFSKRGQSLFSIRIESKMPSCRNPELCPV